MASKSAFNNVITCDKCGYHTLKITADYDYKTNRSNGCYIRLKYHPITGSARWIKGCTSVKDATIAVKLTIVKLLRGDR